MSNIPLKCLLGAFAVVSITGCDAIANKGFCQKTDKGYEICIKKENISCNLKAEKYYKKHYQCKASGISTSLTGEENHWRHEGHYQICGGDSRKIICGAAEHFGMLKKY